MGKSRHARTLSPPDICGWIRPRVASGWSAGRGHDDSVVIPAIVLAAGESRRMGSPKALLRAADGRPFVVRITAVLLAGGASEVVVVTGLHHDPIVQTVQSGDQDSRVRLVRNPDPSRGQLSSL